MTETSFDFGHLAQGGFPLQTFEAGEKIFVQDDEGAHMYVVRSGRVNIVASGTILENVGPNGIFGEMSLLDGSPRSATAVAQEPTEVAVIDERAFLYTVEQNPRLALQLLRRLADRLRRMNQSL
ncbi:MAG: cyclic nucleotide-binding domain-containing protein [Hyphomicrobium sp.]